MSINKDREVLQKCVKRQLTLDIHAFGLDEMLDHKIPLSTFDEQKCEHLNTFRLHTNVCVKGCLFLT